VRDISGAIRRGRTTRIVGGVTTSLLLYAALTAALYRGMAPSASGAPSVRYSPLARAPTRDIALRDGLFYLNRRPFFVRAVGWDPTRPGELPWKRQFHREELEADLQRIRSAGFNTVRTWASLGPEELEIVERHGLHVLQGIWVPPDGAFADPAFRRETLATVARAVERSRTSAAILGYLVLNEPRAKAVARSGLPAARSFLRELVTTVRALDPTAPVGYASWPGMEALDDEELDFTAFNIYPHRPRVVMDEFGLGGYVRLLKEQVAGKRPFLVSEFGISVSPGRPVPTPGRGGASEEEQARGLVQLASTFLSAGAAGTSVFQWNDGWWKNNDGPGDELTHDAMDPEEWFGLIRFAELADRRGTPRPALAALSTYQRTLLIEPRDGQVTSARIPVRIDSDGPVSLSVSVDGGPASSVVLSHEDNGFWTASLPRPPGGTRHDYRLELSTGPGTATVVEHRLLRTGAERGVHLSLAPRDVHVSPGSPFTMEVAAVGGASGMSVSIATFTEDHYNEERISVRLDARGRARVRLRAPREDTLLTVLAFEDDPALPPSERAAVSVPVEVRQAP
jgi:glycosyl hydrolase family 2